MSVFYCDHCDQLVDSDYAPEFEYNEKDQDVEGFVFDN